MKKLVVLTCVVGLVTVANAELLPLTNPGFENGLTGWTQNPLGAGSTIATTADAYAGSLAALLGTDWQTGDGVKAEIGQLTAAGSITPGVDYDFELYVKGLMGVGGIASAEIFWWDEGGFQQGGSGVIPLSEGLSNTYQLKGGTYTAPAFADYAQVSIRLEGGALAAVNTLTVDAIPEPSTFGLVGVFGLAILAVRRKRSRSTTKPPPPFGPRSLDFGPDSRTG
jgi:hypothetical protein